MPSDAQAFRISSANGVSASAISVVTIGTSSPCLRMVATSGGRSFATRCRFHVPALAHGDVHAVEAKSGGRRGQFFALHELQVLGEDRHLEFRLGLGRASQRGVLRRPGERGARGMNL